MKDFTIYNYTVNHLRCAHSRNVHKKHDKRRKRRTPQLPSSICHMGRC